MIVAAERVCEWTCEGGRKALALVMADGRATRKTCRHIIVCREWAIIVNLGGTAETLVFVLRLGQRLFCIFRRFFYGTDSMAEK